MESRRGGLVIPEMRVGDEAMRRLWLVVVGVDGVLVPVPALDSDVLTAGVREDSPRPVKTWGRGQGLGAATEASSAWLPNCVTLAVHPPL